MEGFLIDFDGVILKNFPDLVSKFIYNYINKLTPINYETIISFVRLFISFPTKDFFTFLFNSLGIEEHFEDFINKVSNLEDNGEIKFEIDDYFNTFIDKCNNNQINFKIFSMADTRRILKTIHNIKLEDIYSLCENSKSNTRTFSHLQKELKIDLNKWVLIDDDPFSLRSGKLNGMFTIMMQNNVFGESEYYLYKDYIDVKVNSFKEVIDYYFKGFR